MFKKLKTNKWTAILVALVLVTSLFVGGTIARYVTSTSSEDEARVAVWGINEVGTTMDLFENQYKLEDGTLIAKSADETEDIIAPGLNGVSQFKIVNTGTLKPEVMYEIAISLDDSEIADEIKNHPGIQWKVDEGEWGTWEEFKTELLSLSGDPSGVKTYAPLDVNHEFANGKTHTVAWQWIMDSGYDVEDTAMGNYAAETGDITAKLSITVTARQTDIDSTGMLEGNGQVYDINNPTPLVFRSAAPTEELVEVKVGNTTLTKNTDYTVDSGSTIITLTETCINRLGVGNYTISIISNNMTAKANFTIAETPVVIPEGATYYVSVPFTYDENWADTTCAVGNYDGYSAKLEGGSPFPETVNVGDTFVYNGYEYKYGAGIPLYDYNTWFESYATNGWGVKYIGTSQTPSALLSHINEKPVTTMNFTYARNQNIIIAPAIPETVTSMDYAFEYCSNLEQAPAINSHITSIGYAFRGCAKLTTIELNKRMDPYDFEESGLQEITGSISEEDKQYILENIPRHQ